MFRTRTAMLVSALLLTTITGRISAQSAASNAPLLTYPPLPTMSAAEQTRLMLGTAPEEITSHASLYVLTTTGYVQSRKGSNGFSCLIEREQLKTVEPVCYDAEGTATTVPARIFREELRVKGIAEAEVARQLEAGYKSGRLHPPRKPGMVYMLSQESLTYNPFTKGYTVPMPHYMLYAPYTKQDDLGGPVSPLIPFVLWAGQPDALIIIPAPDPAHMSM